MGSPQQLAEPPLFFGKCVVLNAQTKGIVVADLVLGILFSEFEVIDAEWTAAKAKYRESVAEHREVPEYDNWNWKSKAESTTSDLHLFLGLKVKGVMQGMMMLSTTPRISKKKGSENKRALYVEYLESAPWNLTEYAGVDALYRGVGRALLAAGIDVSLDAGCEGRLALHSLKNAEKTYMAFGFDCIGFDNEEKLNYFESGAVETSQRRV